MSKEKKVDHLYLVESVAKSILLNTTATAACGQSRKLTREDVEHREYRKICQDCFAASAQSASPEALTILAKLGWVDLLERAYLQAIAPKITYTWQNTGNVTHYMGKVQGWDK